MATYDLKGFANFAGSEPKTGAQLSRILGFLKKSFAMSPERRAYLDTLRELQSLSDRELDDIGISRGDIQHVAREAAEMKHAHA
jgi:uncharacterized protein YjiS (DUF1127 family)